jgi:hypothetical protein
MKFRAIVPKHPPVDLRAVSDKVHHDLRDFGVEFQHKMEDYPPARPWKRPPKSGLRRGGRRTGALKGGWAGGLHMGHFEVTVENRVKYAPYVQGKRPGRKGEAQTEHMRRRGWQNVTDTARALWPKYQTRLRKSLAGK